MMVCSRLFCNKQFNCVGLNPALALFATSALVACIAVEFYQMVANKPYLLAQGNSMKITNAF
jgi:hypothetical protein